MSDHGVVTEAGTIRFDRLLPGPVERVWQFLTDSDKRGRWLAFGDMPPLVGGHFRLEFHNCKLGAGDPDIPAKYRDHCQDGVSLNGQVLAWTPNRQLMIRWGEGDEASEVTFDLSPVGDQVRLILTHRRLCGPEMMLSVAAGWHTHLGILADDLAGRTAPGFWAAHTALESDYQQRLMPA